MKKRILLALAALTVVNLFIIEAVGQTRIRFARGRTSTSLSGTIGNIGERDFVLRAYAGQYLSATVSSPGDCIKFSTIETSQAFRTDSGDNWLKLMNMCRRTVSYRLIVSVR